MSRPPRSPRPLRALWASGTGGFALTALALLLLAAAVSLVWLPHNPAEANAYRSWQPPSPEFWLGTDGSGRDIFSRIMVGSRITVIVALGAGAISAVLGLALAAAGGLGGRWLREPVTILVDVLIAFPTLIIAMMLAAAFGSGIPVVVVAVGIGFGVSIGRVVRAEIRQVAASDFVMAARAAGVSRWKVFLRHILPNVSPVFIVQLSLSMGLAVLAEAGLSYLGFGAPPSMPSWGLMLSEMQIYVSLHPVSVLWPGLAITVIVLAFNLLGDALRDLLDPAVARQASRGTRPSEGVLAR